MTRPHVLVFIGWALLSVAWAFGNPPFAGPDEDEHYLRALEVGRGDLVGERLPSAATGATQRQLDYIRQLTYAMTIPAGLAPHDFECYIRDRNQSAACLDDVSPPATETDGATQVGNYHPLPYLAPAAATRAADSPGPALRLARLANALLALILLGIAVRLAWSADIGAPSLLGIVAAVTPMVIFCGAVLNPSGVEIAAAIAFTVALLRLRRDASCARSPRVWAAIGASALVLALSRTSGPLWVVLIGAAAVALLGPRASWQFVRTGGRKAWLALGATATAVVLNRVWERAHGPDTEIGVSNARAVLDDAVDEWWRASSELVGKFGYLEYRLPWIAYVGWFAAGFALLAVAIAVSRRVERRALLGVAVAALVLPMLFWIVAIRQTGFGLQGRHVLPILIVVPLLAGDVLREHAARLSDRTRRALLIGVPLTAAAVHLIAFYWAARRAAVGVDGPLFFLGSADWTPPLGWLPWLALASAGAGCIAAAALGTTYIGAAAHCRRAAHQAR